MAKKLVRLALACEYGRRPIRRQEINEKVLGSFGGRAKLFNAVFQQAQHQLEYVFGMKMIELPAREKITLQQRRAAQKKDSQSQSKATGSWMMTNVLPDVFRDPDILSPPAAPTSAVDAEYTAIYTTLVSLILLSGDRLPDTKMDRFLRKLGIDDRTTVPGYEKNEQLMKRLEKDGYLYKLKESTGTGEDDTFYVVGPRGRVEIGNNGVRGLVRAVMPPGDDEEEEADLDNKVLRSLGISDRPAAGGSGTQQNRGAAQTRGRRRKSAARDEEEQDEGAEEQDEEDDDEEDE